MAGPSKNVNPCMDGLPSSLHPWAKILPGVGYIDYLGRIHKVCKPSSYFEIGVETGRTLRLAQCHRVAVDPDFRLQPGDIEEREGNHLFEMTSDDFFARHNLKRVLPGGPDLVFLDGLHLYEYLLRDLINTERHSHKATVVVMHDCYPINCEIAGREPHGPRTDEATKHWWTGDVWKLLPILREYRADLRVSILDCPPTGLVVVQGLDARSKILSKAYDKIIAKYQDIDLAKFGLSRLQGEFPTISSRDVFEPDSLRTFLAPASLQWSEQRHAQGLMGFTGRLMEYASRLRPARRKPFRK